ncbi:MAG TPA: DMT family transporter [Dongiaceae bacterium]|jgi:drug/metabolite transporter (DMT)-like permease|nr:DMT family transporter [Dongiaceae bacterium]
MTGAVEAHRAETHGKGVFLVLAAAFCWSSGGLIARHITADVWTQAAGRGFFAAVTLLLFLLIRDGRNTWSLFRGLGLPGVVVACCFAAASLSFVVALKHATVALILVIQSTVPLIAGLIAFAWLRERVGWVRGIAMLVALFGVWRMVSGGGGSGNDTLGIALSCVIPCVLAVATVTVRRYRAIRMTPAMCLAAAIIMVVGLVVREGAPVSGEDVFLLLLFGAVQLAVGMIFFATGARLIPAGEAALLGLLECVLGPVWVWIFLGEHPGDRVLLGGLLTLAAVAGNTVYDMARASRVSAIGV